WKLFFLHGGGSAAQILESKNKSLAEHQNPNTLKRLNEADRAKKICRINNNKLFKEQEYHDAVRHHTEAIQRNPKEPTVMDSSFWAAMQTKRKPVSPISFFLIRLSRIHRHFDDLIPSTSNGGWKLFFLHGGGSAAHILESKNKSLAEHQNPNTLKRLNEADRAKKICRINSNKLFKEQEYHDAVRHHTEAIQRNPKEPTSEPVSQDYFIFFFFQTRPRGMQDPGIKNILTDLTNRGCKAGYVSGGAEGRTLQALANTFLELPYVDGHIQFVKGADFNDSPSLWWLCTCPYGDDAAATLRGLLNSGDKTQYVIVVTAANPKIFGEVINFTLEILTVFTYDEATPGLKAIVSAKVELQYLHPHVGICTSVGLTANPVVNFSGVIGTSVLALGTDVCQVSFDTESGNFKHFNTGVSFTKDDLIAALTLNDKGENTVVGAEVNHNLKSQVISITVGAQHSLDPLTTVKARVNNAGIANPLIQHEWRPKSFITIFGEVDSRGIEKSAKVGFTIALKP
ncbi:hypothetical protein F2Q69_00043571, partial [Brassica cretica]